MTEYSWHVLRADSERALAYRAGYNGDAAVARLHDELARLHLRAADELSAAWRIFAVEQAEAAGSALDDFTPLFAGLYIVSEGEREQAQVPPALFADSPRR